MRDRERHMVEITQCYSCFFGDLCKNLSSRLYPKQDEILSGRSRITANINDKDPLMSNRLQSMPFGFFLLSRENTFSIMILNTSIKSKELVTQLIPI